MMLIFPGGYIELHVDTNPKSNQKVVDYDAGPSEWLITGERLMTFMVYLSSVEEGGNTAFPLLGVTVPPSQGTALFWHTVTSSGYQDQRMKHLGKGDLQRISLSKSQAKRTSKKSLKT